MKISELVIDVIERKAPSVRVQDERTDLGGTTKQGVLRIKNRDGLEGNAFVGEQAGNSSQRMETIIRLLKPIVIGREVSDREWLWNQLGFIAGHNIVFSEKVPYLPHTNLRVTTLRSFGIDDGSETHRASSRFICSARSHDYDAWERLKF